MASKCQSPPLSYCGDRCCRASSISFTVSRIPSPSPRGVVMAATSRVFRAIRASPAATEARCAAASSSSSMFRPPSPRVSSSSALWTILCRSSSESGSRRSTRHRESRALLTSKDGFSVVAPMRVSVPFSTVGSTASCCSLLKRWISSMNRMVRLPCMPNRSRASAVALCRSFTPALTALSATKWESVARAMMKARVVLPEPGGPQRIIEKGVSRSMDSFRSRPWPTSPCWPRKPSSESGRMRAASGASRWSCFSAWSENRSVME